MDKLNEKQDNPIQSQDIIDCIIESFLEKYSTDSFYKKEYIWHKDGKEHNIYIETINAASIILRDVCGIKNLTFVIYDFLFEDSMMQLFPRFNAKSSFDKKDNTMLIFVPSLKHEINKLYMKEVLSCFLNDNKDNMTLHSINAKYFPESNLVKEMPDDRFVMDTKFNRIILCP